MIPTASPFTFTNVSLPDTDLVPATSVLACAYPHQSVTSYLILKAEILDDFVVSLTNCKFNTSSSTEN